VAQSSAVQFLPPFFVSLLLMRLPARHHTPLDTPTLLVLSISYFVKCDEGIFFRLQAYVSGFDSSLDGVCDGASIFL
jgi:hypothetical protein